jgi:hypothetical protein
MRDAWRAVLARTACGEPFFSFDETRRWRQTEFEQFSASGLLREGGQAQFVTCDACDDAHREEVIWRSSVREPSGMRAYIPCPVEMALHVPAERLRQWSVDADEMARQIAASMELAGTVENVLVGRLWKLGRRRLAGRFRDTFFAVVTDSDGQAIAETAVAHLNATHGILLVLGNMARLKGWQIAHFTVLEAPEVVSFDAGRLDVALDYIEDALPRERGAEKSAEIRNVPIPEGSTWEQLTIAVRETSLLVNVCGYEKELSLEEAGFADGRKGDGDSNRPLQVLRLFASRRGRIVLGELPGGETEKTRVRKQVSVLRMRFRSLFAIDGESIILEKAPGQYRCAFGVRLGGDSGYPTPAGASWLDFRIEEAADGRIAVGVKSKVVFRAPQIRGDDARGFSVAAERDERAWREYSMAALGLANDAGHPSPEGQTLLEILRSEGKLQRSPDDMAVLKLGRWLREWTGIEDDPIRYSAGKRAWIAHFECGPRRNR